MNVCKNTYDFIKSGVEFVAPSPDNLWLRGGAVMEDRQIDSERIESVPIFYDSKIDSYEPIGEPVEIINKGLRVGTKQHYRFEMTTGITRDAVVYLPLADKQEEMQFTIHMDTPWMTGEDGHNNRIARAFMQHTSQPVIMVGPENITRYKDTLHVAKNLGAVAMDTSKISLALAAQDSMQIAAVLADIQSLPRQLIEVGESRGAMIAPAKHPHGEGLGLQNVYYDLTDPNLAKNAMRDWRSVRDIPLFLGGIALDLPSVGVDLMMRGDLFSEAGTVPMRARYMAAAIMGTGPAVLSGEAGRFPAYLPSNIPVNLISFRRNPLSHHGEFRKLFAHTQFAGANLKGAHLGLAYSSVQRHVIERINNFIHEYNCAGGSPETIVNMDFKRVHLLGDQRFLGPGESAPKVERRKKTPHYGVKN